MSSAKRPRTSGGGESARGSSHMAAAAAASRFPASQPAAAAASGQRHQVVGARTSNAAAAAAGGPAGADGDDPIDVDAPADSDDAWTYPEPSTFLDGHVAYQYRLTPQVAPVFHKYKQAGIDTIVGEVMKFILQRTSAGHVVTHKDVLNVLADRCKSGAGAILSDARRRFMELYGYDLHEIESDSHKRKSAGSSATTSSSSKTYILCMPAVRSVGLRRAFNHDLQLAKDQDDAAAKRGLLFWIYALIHAEESAQGSAEGANQQKGCTESKLWRNMKNVLNIDRDVKSHEIFGNISNLIDEFVKQQYLSRVKLVVDGSAAGEPSPRQVDTVAYRIGQRGQAEISTTDLYTGMMEQMSGTAPDPTHLSQIKRNEQMGKGAAAPKKAAPAGAPAPAASQR